MIVESPISRRSLIINNYRRFFLFQLEQFLSSIDKINLTWYQSDRFHHVLLLRYQTQHSGGKKRFRQLGRNCFSREYRADGNRYAKAAATTTTAVLHDDRS